MLSDFLWVGLYCLLLSFLFFPRSFTAAHYRGGIVKIFPSILDLLVLYIRNRRSHVGFGELPGPLFFLKKILAVIFPVGCMLFMLSGRCGQVSQNI